jgi:deazaflavin-dependent oxidoreductase (nitroreductase family)
MAAAAVERSSPPIPRWLVRAIWQLHRAAYTITRGRFGLRTPAPGRWGMLRLTTLGRRTARKRGVILGYLEDGPNLFTPAMNGWADPEPAWWLNLQANPHATVHLPGGHKRAVTARAANPEERRRLWQRLVDLGTAAYTDAYAAMRSRETAIVILEPRADREHDTPLRTRASTKP